MRTLTPQGPMRLAVTVVTAALAGCTATNDVEIRNVLDAQAVAWNRGDIPAYMKHYWRSEELTFSSGGNTQRGWEATKARYESRYPTPERMGRLTFDALDVQPLCEGNALVLGRWNLERSGECMGGNFTLVMRRIHGRWQIIHDHTSLDPAAGGETPTASAGD